MPHHDCGHRVLLLDRPQQASSRSPADEWLTQQLTKYSASGGLAGPAAPVDQLPKFPLLTGRCWRLVDDRATRSATNRHRQRQQNNGQAILSWKHLAPQPVGFLIFWICALAPECERLPFDRSRGRRGVCGTGYQATEYSGMKFAFFYLGTTSILGSRPCGGGLLLSRPLGASTIPVEWLAGRDGQSRRCRPCRAGDHGLAGIVMNRHSQA